MVPLSTEFRIAADLGWILHRDVLQKDAKDETWPGVAASQYTDPGSEYLSQPYEEGKFDWIVTRIGGSLEFEEETWKEQGE